MIFNVDSVVCFSTKLKMVEILRVNVNCMNVAKVKKRFFKMLRLHQKSIKLIFFS